MREMSDSSELMLNGMHGFFQDVPDAFEDVYDKIKETKVIRDTDICLYYIVNIL